MSVALATLAQTAKMACKEGDRPLFKRNSRFPASRTAASGCLDASPPPGIPLAHSILADGTRFVRRSSFPETARVPSILPASPLVAGFRPFPRFPAFFLLPSPLATAGNVRDWGKQALFANSAERFLPAFLSKGWGNQATGANLPGFGFSVPPAEITGSGWTFRSGAPGSKTLYKHSNFRAGLPVMPYPHSGDRDNARLSLPAFACRA